MMAIRTTAVVRLCVWAALLAGMGCGGGQRSENGQNPCDEDARFSSVTICLVPASDEQRRGVPITDDCYWLNKAIGDKRLVGLNAEGMSATYDVYVRNFCAVAADVDLAFPDADIVCDNALASGSIPIGTVPPDGEPRRGTCRTIAYKYVDSVPQRRGRYTLSARIGSSIGTYDPEVVLERAGEPVVRDADPPAPEKPPVP